MTRTAVKFILFLIFLWVCAAAQADATTGNANNPTRSSGFFRSLLDRFGNKRSQEIDASKQVIPSGNTSSVQNERNAYAAQRAAEQAEYRRWHAAEQAAQHAEYNRQRSAEKAEYIRQRSAEETEYARWHAAEQAKYAEYARQRAAEQYARLHSTRQ